MNISSLQTDYLNLYSSSGFGINSEIANTVQTNCAFLEVLIILQKKKSKVSDKKGKNLVQILLRTIDKQNGHLGNFLDVDLKIT